MAKSRRKDPKDLKYPHRPPIADNPRLIKDWDWDKNTAYDPHVLTCGSEQRVWWKCPICGKSYLRSVANQHVTSHACKSCGAKLGWQKRKNANT